MLSESSFVFQIKEHVCVFNVEHVFVSVSAFNRGSVQWLRKDHHRHSVCIVRRLFFESPWLRMKSISAKWHSSLPHVGWHWKLQPVAFIFVCITFTALFPLPRKLLWRKQRRQSMMPKDDGDGTEGKACRPTALSLCLHFTLAAINLHLCSTSSEPSLCSAGIAKSVSDLSLSIDSSLSTDSLTVSKHRKHVPFLSLWGFTVLSSEIFCECGVCRPVLLTLLWCLWVRGKS